MNEITSRQNIKVKTWLTLLEASGIKKSGRALISGEKLVREFLVQNPERAEDLIFSSKSDAGPSSPGHEFALPAQVKCYRLQGALFNSLDSLGTGYPLLCVRTPEISSWQGGSPKGLELIVALSDPGNLGALLRSAEAFGVARVILTREACHPFLPRAIRASSGASFRIPLARAEKSLDEIEISDAYALDMKGMDLAQFKWPNDIYLVLGEEGRGLPQGKKLKTLAIPMAGLTESLNATTAASIALYIYRQQVKSK